VEKRSLPDSERDIRMTQVEAEEDNVIRATQMVDRLPPLVGHAPIPLPLPSGAPTTPGDADTSAPAVPFRPINRPPLPFLLIIDDNRVTFEQVRLRKANYVIGRDHGDIVIAHDGQMSGRHAELVRESRDGGFRWLLKDLGSTNGTFVLVDRMKLQNGDELLLGSRVCRFELPESKDPKAADTQRPTIVFYGGKHTGVRLDHDEHWIGRDPEVCGELAADDPLLDPKHALLFRNPAGKWHVQSSKGVNGVWARVREVVLRGNCRFQLGEQQFLFCGNDRR